MRRPPRSRYGAVAAVRGLSLEVWNPHSLGDPWIVVRLSSVLRPTRITKLPVQPPARITAFGDINEALAFVLEIAVVVHREQVSEFIERNLLRIAQAYSEDFQLRTVRVHPKYGA